MTGWEWMCRHGLLPNEPNLPVLTEAQAAESFHNQTSVILEVRPMRMSGDDRCHYCGLPMDLDGNDKFIQARTGNGWAHVTCWYDGGPFEREVRENTLKEGGVSVRGVAALRRCLKPSRRGRLMRYRLTRKAERGE